MAETELSALTRQCLDRRIPDRNDDQSDIDWQFTIDNARIKLKRLYPATLHDGLPAAPRLAECQR